MPCKVKIVCGTCAEVLELSTLEGPQTLRCSCKNLLLEIPAGVTAFVEGAWFDIHGDHVDGGAIKQGDCEMEPVK